MYAGYIDTWVLRNGSSRFEPYAKRLTESVVVTFFSYMHQGEIFALAYAPSEPDKIIFRSTQAERTDSLAVSHKTEEGVTNTGTSRDVKHGSGDKVTALASSFPKTGDHLILAGLFSVFCFMVLGVVVVRRRPSH